MCRITAAAFVTVGPFVAATADDDAAAETLDEIIVTATRRDLPLNSVPLSVHVITGEELQRFAATAFADYARTVPGLSFTDGGTGGEKQTIRGVSVDPWTEVNPGTAIHLDEVPLTHAGGVIGPPFNPDPALIDIDRIEVLRGPQGTLFGAGSMGGAIRIITRQPDFERTSAEVNATLTTTQDGEVGYGVHGIVNVPTGDGRVALRAVAFQRDLGGFIDNVLDGRDNVDNRELRGGRLAGRFQVADRALVTARIIHQERSSTGLSHEEPMIGKRQQSRFNESIGDEWTNYNVQVDVDLDWGSLLSSTSYLDRIVDTRADVSFFLRAFFGLDNPLNVVNKERVDELVQEFRIVSDSGGQFEWLAGMFLQAQEQELSQDFPSPGFDAATGGLASMFGPPDVLYVGREKYSLDQLAAYGELSYRVTQSLELTAGGRWYDIDRNYEADNFGLLFVMGSIAADFAASDAGFIPRASLNYTIRDGLSIFAVVAEGFRPGGINNPGPISEPTCAMELESLGFTDLPTSYDSDSLVSYELGTRFQTAGGRTRLSAAAYHIDWSDMQTQKFLNCGTGFVENAGAADSDGIEVEVVALPVDGIELFVTGSYNRAELSEDVPNLNGVKGDRLPGVPRITARAGASFEYAASGDKSYFLHADLQHVGNSYMGFDSETSRELPAYTVGNLRIGMGSDTWTAALFVQNVADEVRAVFINDNALGEWLTQIRPRTIGVDVNWRF